MCGLVGAITDRNVIPRLISGLKGLRCDSCAMSSVSVISEYGIRQEIIPGGYFALDQRVAATGLCGHTGIGLSHAGTAEQPKLFNAHVQSSHGKITVAHIGSLENLERIHCHLVSHGYRFNSQSETETIAHRIHYYSEKGWSLSDSAKLVVDELRGDYAFLAISSSDPSKLIVAQAGKPLYILSGYHENIVVSDIAAVSAYSERLTYLQDGDVAEISLNKIKIMAHSGCRALRRVRQPSLKEVPPVSRQPDFGLVKSA